MKILVVEDDEIMRATLVSTLRQTGWDVDTVSDGNAALKQLDGTDLMMTDIRLPGMDGIELLKKAREGHPNLEVIVMTGYGSIPSAIEAMKAGARAYLTKPFEVDELLPHLREVKKLIQLRETASRAGRGNLIGGSKSMQLVYEEIDIAAASTATLLITGETGSGKDLAATAVHNLSSRENDPFVALNLGALPRDLLEGELFGHEKGAFTGASSQKKGRFVVAHGGTLFLDEIDALPVELQPKLLRFLESMDVWPLGAEKSSKVDVRIMAATNANLDEMVKAGTFREDLYYRLNVLRIAMPPLREHPDDIPSIARALLDRMAPVFSLRRIDITAEALSHLLTREWKGNVRELSNVVERALARSSASLKVENPDEDQLTLDIGDFDLAISPTPEMVELPFREGKSRAADEWAKRTITSVLAVTEGNVSKAARQLKMSRTALIRLINRYGIKAR